MIQYRRWAEVEASKESSGKRSLDLPVEGRRPRGRDCTDEDMSDKGLSDGDNGKRNDWKRRLGTVFRIWEKLMKKECVVPFYKSVTISNPLLRYCHITKFSSTSIFSLL